MRADGVDHLTVLGPSHVFAIDAHDVIALSNAHVEGVRMSIDLLNAHRTVAFDHDAERRREAAFKDTAREWRHGQVVLDREHFKRSQLEEQVIGSMASKIWLDWLQIDVTVQRRADGKKSYVVVHYLETKLGRSQVDVACERVGGGVVIERERLMQLVAFGEFATEAMLANRLGLPQERFPHVG